MIPENSLRLHRAMLSIGLLSLVSLDQPTFVAMVVTMSLIAIYKLMTE
uniref:Uncharacterized protein n=1 Tax=Rhizophora mucronata TaxID=61149 RepID=A0A2P2Q4Y9_RHIMU